MTEGSHTKWLRALTSELGRLREEDTMGQSQLGIPGDSQTPLAIDIDPISRKKERGKTRNSQV